MTYKQYIDSTINRAWIETYPWLSEWALNEFSTFDLLYSEEATDRLINNNIIDNILEIQKLDTIIKKQNFLTDDNNWVDSNIVDSNTVSNSDLSNTLNYQGFNVEGEFSKDSALQKATANTSTSSKNVNLLNILLSLKNSDLLNAYKNIAKVWRSLLILCYN